MGVRAIVLLSFALPALAVGVDWVLDAAVEVWLELFPPPPLETRITTTTITATIAPSSKAPPVLELGALNGARASRGRAGGGLDAPAGPVLTALDASPAPARAGAGG